MHDPLHDLVCDAFGYDKSIVRALALWVRENTKPDQHPHDLALRVIEAESLAHRRSLCAVVHPTPDTGHTFLPWSYKGEDRCRHSWRVEGERTYCRQPRSAHNAYLS
jgi:hypothetical protein